MRELAETVRVVSPWLIAAGLLVFSAGLSGIVHHLWFGGDEEPDPLAGSREQALGELRRQAAALAEQGASCTCGEPLPLGLSAHRGQVADTGGDPDRHGYRAASPELADR